MTTYRGARIPVIVGVGELLDRHCDPSLEPVEMLVRCIRAAAADTTSDQTTWLQQIDLIRIVNSASWPYRDLPDLLTRRLRLQHRAEAIHGPVGGESPVRMLVDCAADIISGRSETAVLCGAEATKTLMQAMSSGNLPAWSDRDEETKRLTADDYAGPVCARYGLSAPTMVYPIYENAMRRAWGLAYDEAQAESGLIWSNMAKIAAGNPFAWSGKTLSPENIVTPSESNRPIAFPYTKFQVAQIGVNQAAAILITHRDAALAAGIPSDRLIYIWAGAGAHEPYDLLARDRYDHAPAQELVLRRTLEINGLTAHQVDHYELYSCFPIVPKMARRALGLPPERDLTVAGGLTFFGAPANNYMTHAISAIVKQLRAGNGRNGFLYGNGEFLTKHHCAIISTQPPPASVVVSNLDLQSELNDAYGPVPALIEDYQGRAVVESYTIGFTNSGKVDRVVLIARTPDGKRTLARVTDHDPETIDRLLDPQAEIIGSDGMIFDGGDGLNHFSSATVAPMRSQAVLFEIVSPHVALVTINRPERRNAINGAVARLLARYVRQIEQDPQIRVAILTGAGGQSFCAGADLEEVASGRTLELTPDGFGFGGFVNATRRKPWIAAVRGFALGGGTEFVLACDLIVAGESAQFGLPEVKRGIVAAAGGAYRLPRSISPRIAMELILTGETVSAKQANELQLVNRLVSDEAVLLCAISLAQAIASNAPLAVCASKEIARRAFDQADTELAQLSLAEVRAVLLSEDAKEGPRAFLQKRKPVWTGR